MLRNWPPVGSELRTAGRRRASWRPAQEVKKKKKKAKCDKDSKQSKGAMLEGLPCETSKIIIIIIITKMDQHKNIHED